MTKKLVKRTETSAMHFSELLKSFKYYIEMASEGEPICEPLAFKFDSGRTNAQKLDEALRELSLRKYYKKVRELEEIYGKNHKISNEDIARFESENYHGAISDMLYGAARNAFELMTYLREGSQGCVGEIYEKWLEGCIKPEGDFVDNAIMSTQVALNELSALAH